MCTTFHVDHLTALTSLVKADACLEAGVFTDLFTSHLDKDRICWIEKVMKNMLDQLCGMLKLLARRNVPELLQPTQNKSTEANNNGLLKAFYRHIKCFLKIF